MRILLYTLAMAVLPMLAQANHIERNLEGFWNNCQTQTTIRVKAKRYGFKVKGLYDSHRWTKFRRNNRGQYRDSRGNKLVIRNRNRIEFVNRYNRLITPFRRASIRNYDNVRPSNRDHYRRKYYDHYGNDNQEGYYGNQYRDANPQGGYYRGESQSNQSGSFDNNGSDNSLSYTPLRIDENRLRSIEGTWKSAGRNGKKVIVVSTRDGIKVKDTTNDKWHRYRLSSDRKSLIDDHGNLYQMAKQSLYWKGNNNKRVLKLEKISGTTF